MRHYENSAIQRHIYAEVRPEGSLTILNHHNDEFGQAFASAF